MERIEQTETRLEEIDEEMIEASRLWQNQRIK